MEPSAISGPLYYLLIVWAVVTGIFLLLLVWRTLLASHEGDQIFLDSAQDHMAREQREVVAKIMKLQKPIRNARFALCSHFDFHVSCAPICPAVLNQNQTG